MEEQPDYSCKEPADRCEYGDQLKSLAISHYRGFGAGQTVKFAHHNGKAGSGLTVICGENNSGKSSIFHVLMKFHTYGEWTNYPALEKDEKDVAGKTHLTETRCNGMSVTLEYTKGRKYHLGEERSNLAHGFMFVKSDVAWTSRGRLQVRPDEHKQKDGIIGTESGGHNGDFEVLQELYDKEIGNYLRALKGDEPRWGKFKRDLKYVIPEWKNIYVTGRQEDNYQIKVLGRSRQRYSADLLGGGYLRLLRILVAFYSGQDQGNSGLVIDEPELYLQPFAQKRLMKLLVSMSTHRQIILVTHSPHFIDWRSISNGAVVVHTHVDKDTEENRVVNITSEELQGVLKLANDWHKPQMLDAVAKELFFTRAVVFTEGQEDVALLNRFATERGIDLNFDWFGYGTGGAQNIRKFLVLAKTLSIAAAAIYDGDQCEEYTKAVNEHGQTARIIMLGKDDIRDKYDDQTNRKKRTKNGYYFADGRAKCNSIGYISTLIKGLNTYFK